MGAAEPVQRPGLQRRLNKEASPRLSSSARQDQWLHLGKEFRAQSSLIWVPRQRAMQALGLAVLPSKGRGASRASLLSIAGSPRHLGSLARELGSLWHPFCRPVRAGNQASSPTQLFSACSTHPCSISALSQRLLPKRDPNSKPHCPRTLLADGSRNQTDDWWRTFSASVNL